MSNPQNTALRYLEILRLIPQYPLKIATSVLHKRLKENEYFISECSLQRDLKDKLSRTFKVCLYDEEMSFRWGSAFGVIPVLKYWIC